MILAAGYSSFHLLHLVILVADYSGFHLLHLVIHLTGCSVFPPLHFVFQKSDCSVIPVAMHFSHHPEVLRSMAAHRNTNPYTIHHLTVRSQQAWILHFLFPCAISVIHHSFGEMKTRYRHYPAITDCKDLLLLFVLLMVKFRHF